VYTRSKRNVDDLIEVQIGIELVESFDDRNRVMLRITKPLNTLLAEPPQRSPSDEGNELLVRT